MMLLHSHAYSQYLFVLLFLRVRMVITPTQNTPISTQVYPTVTRVLPTASAPPFMDEDYCPECGQVNEYNCILLVNI